MENMTIEQQIFYFKERELYWQAIFILREIISDGNKTKEELLEEIESDL